MEFEYEDDADTGQVEFVEAYEGDEGPDMEDCMSLAIRSCTLTDCYRE